MTTIKKNVLLLISILLVSVLTESCEPSSNEASEEPIKENPEELNIEFGKQVYSTNYMGEDLASEQAYQATSSRTNYNIGYAFDGNKNTYWSANIGETSMLSLEIVFKEKQSVDAVIVSEREASITDFKIQSYQNSKWHDIYVGDEIGEERLITFDKIDGVEKIKLLIVKAGATPTIHTFQVHKRNVVLDNFRVTSYLPATNNPELWITDYSTNIDYITELELIGAFKVDEAGAIVSNPLWGETVARLNIKKYHELIGNRDIKKWISITPDIPFLSNNLNARTAFFNNIVRFLQDNDFDGIGIDWEYPSGSAQWSLYSKFITDLHSHLAPKNLSISLAVAGWGVNLSKDAINVVEHFNVMSYDRFDFDLKKRHEIYQLSRADASFLTGKGIPLAKLNLGIGWYGRGIDGTSWGPGYKGLVEKYNIGPENNLVNGLYHNGINMSRDKTALAINLGAGGVMLFALTYDLPATDSRAAVTKVADVVKAATK